MGNCMRTCKQRQQEEDGEKEGGQSVKESSGFVGSRGVVRVKLVLTKEELEWLVFQLKSNDGGKEKISLESALEVIERGRERVKVVESTWKPSLDSIVETSE